MYEVTDDESISAPLRALVELFNRELEAVRFPDIDGKVLAEAAQRVREKAEAVERAEAALEAAREALAESQEVLMHKGQRAYAYARVYAEEDAELSAKLEALNLPRPARKGALAGEAPAAGEESPQKRRGRPPKAKPNAPLFHEGAAPAVAAVPEVEAERARPAA
jgi:predicted DNA-binding protein (UPF0251 family)